MKSKVCFVGASSGWVLSIGEEFSPTYNQKHPKYSIFAVSLIRTSNLVIIIVIINLLSDLR